MARVCVLGFQAHFTSNLRMITSGFLYVIYAVVFAVTSPIRLFADATIPIEIHNSILEIDKYITAVSGIVPLDTLFAVLGYFVTVEVAIFTLKGVLWLIRRIPTQS